MAAHTLAALLQSKRQDLVNALVAHLRKSAFDNAYTLHPRRLAELGAEIAGSFFLFIDSSSHDDAIAFGQTLAQEGVGKKTIVSLTFVLHRFCAEQARAAAQADPAHMDTIDAFTSALLEGFMDAFETQILSDQEQLRRALSTALKSQGQELLIKDHAITTAINGIMLADLDGKVSYVNPSFLTIWGFTSPEEAIGRHIGEFWAGEEARKIMEILPQAGGWRGELVAKRKDQSSLNVELSASLIRDEKMQGIGIMTSFVDVTDKKRLQTQVIQAQKMEALGHLAGGIVHDFNNLLTAISGYLQLLLIDTPRDTPAYLDLMQIMAAVDRGTALTRQLRFFTRQATGTRQVVSLNDIVRDTWEIIRRTFPPQIAIDLSFSPVPMTIEADPNQMSQVLVNLCVNARDAMMERVEGTGGVRALTIATSSVELTEKEAAHYVNGRPGKYVVLRVRDTGIGIPPEMLERLFIPFVTTKPARSGTGLGLAVVYGIVASHFGFIDVKSTVGQGSVFDVFLPMSERQTETAARDGREPPLPRGHGTILVVDDEPQVREVITRMLQGCGYTIITAADGREALVKFGAGVGIDLVVLDMVMPDMGGRECLLLLRKADPHVRVLIATGHIIDGSAQELLGEGALGVVEKPFHLQSLAAAVQNALGGAPRAC
jgi:two-component system cell cycle sensor histidine kinase/response regulator CckA